MNIKVTSAQDYLLHTFLSLFTGAILAGIIAAGQFALSNSFDLKLVVGCGLSAFGARFLPGLGTLGNSPQLAQAEQDTLKEGVAALTASHLNLTQVIGQLVGVVHETSSAQAQPVQQVAFPAPTVASVPKLVAVPPAEDTMPHAALGK